MTRYRLVLATLELAQNELAKLSGTVQHHAVVVHVPKLVVISPTYGTYMNFGFKFGLEQPKRDG